MRDRKLTVAVSGGFAPLHSGHVELFREAKALGDSLVVILNNDNWLIQKKGFVFMKEEERAIVISALEMVDRVVITNHPEKPTDMSVVDALLDIRPDIFANGGDRVGDTNQETREEEACRQIGAKAVYGIGKNGKIQSSSWILDEFIESYQGKNE